MEYPLGPVQGVDARPVHWGRNPAGAGRVGLTGRICLTERVGLGGAGLAA